ncbi:MAG: phosphatidylserine decarboxylase [Euryarchaeota archaeon]|nr:phosphatidylserine decarboxylase [Euryarchaeota archaeon]
MMRIANGGFSWILASFALTFVVIGASFFSTGLLLIFLGVVSVFFFLMSCLLIVFFRDPERIIGPGVVAVADGKIREITTIHDTEVGECIQISTFMNIHNVHVNRMPLDGTIEEITHYNGGHLPAFKKESEKNERVVLLIHTDIGRIKIVQIAGTLARRIVPYVSKGNTVKKGGKIGLIRLGSRVDLYLPTKRIKPLAIQVTNKIKAGEDTIAEIHD